MSYGLTTEAEFIKRRATGQSLESISKDMQIARSTLSAWDRDYAELIERSYLSLKDTLISETVSQLALDFKGRISAIAQSLTDIDIELSKRDLSDVSTADLYKLKLRYLMLAESIITDTPRRIKYKYKKPEEDTTTQETSA